MDYNESCKLLIHAKAVNYLMTDDNQKAFEQYIHRDTRPMVMRG